MSAVFRSMEAEFQPLSLERLSNTNGTSRGETERVGGKRIAQQMGVPWALAENEEGLAEIAIQRGEWTTAARLLGSAAALRDMLGTPATGYARDRAERRLAELRPHMVEPDVTAAWEDGRSLEFRQAAVAALAMAEQAAAPS